MDAARSSGVFDSWTVEQQRAESTRMKRWLAEQRRIGRVHVPVIGTWPERKAAWWQAKQMELAAVRVQKAEARALKEAQKAIAKETKPRT